MPAASCPCRGRAGNDAAWARKGGVIFVDGAPVVPSFEEAIAFFLVLIKVG